MPRDVDWSELVQALSCYGYRVVRQTGSHIRLTTTMHGEHHLTVPAHKPVRVGTLNQIVGMVASHAGVTRAAVMDQLFGR